MTKLTSLPTDYAPWLAELKTRIAKAQLRATLAVNAELIQLYWEIGHSLLERQQKYGWGSKVIDTLANNLRHAFPEMKGFSLTNLKYMRRFAEECPAKSFGQQAADQLPWFHIVILLTQFSNTKGREWYAAKCGQAKNSFTRLAPHTVPRLFTNQLLLTISFLAALASLGCSPAFSKFPKPAW